MQSLLTVASLDLELDLEMVVLWHSRSHQQRAASVVGDVGLGGNWWLWSLRGCAESGGEAMPLCIEPATMP